MEFSKRTALKKSQNLDEAKSINLCSYISTFLKNEAAVTSDGTGDF